MAALSFIEPELASLSDMTLVSFFEREPALHEYRFYLAEIAARKGRSMNLVRG